MNCRIVEIKYSKNFPENRLLKKNLLVIGKKRIFDNETKPFCITDEMNRSATSSAATIHLFAAAHAAVAILCRVTDYYDDVLLTILTVLLIVIIAMRHGLTPGLTAALTLLGCFLGLLLGVYGAQAIGRIVPDPTLASAAATFCITEMIGWSTVLIAARNRGATRRKIAWSPSTKQVLAVAAGVLALRLFYTQLFRTPDFEQEGIYTRLADLFSNTLVLLGMLCINTIAVSYVYRRKALASQHSLAGFIVLLVLGFSLVVTLGLYYRIPFGRAGAPADEGFFRLYAVVLLADIVLYALLSLIGYAITSHVELKAERDKKHRAQYQYSKLKQQINPHFLFNSLNILDYLVQEQQTERASGFIQKLAGMYRYMLKNEDETVVPLSEELHFARMYIELLYERFSCGFTVKIDIPQMRMTRHVVPCCLQLLIENATKHNIISAEQPLAVSITADERYLIVRNNLQPRLSSKSSTGLGLKIIRQQYLDLAGEAIVTGRTPTEFYVKLPLI